MKKLLTRKEVAKAFDVHPMTITKWEQDGMPVAVRGSGGRASKYDKRKVAEWKAARDLAAQTPGAVSVQQERARKERAQAILAEQTYQSRGKELLPRDEVKRVMASRAMAIRTKLLAWPTTLADKLHRASTLDGVAGVERALNDAVHDVLVELASGDETP